MTAPTSNRSRRFSMPDLGDERVDEAITAFLSGPEHPEGEASAAAIKGRDLPEVARGRRVHPLAAIAKHDAWLKALERESRRSQRYGRPAAVLVIVGLPATETDEARAWVGRVADPIAHSVRRGVRASDLATRTGAATFQVLLPETTDREAKHAAERMMADCRVWLQAIDAPVILRWAAVGSMPGVPLESALARAHEEIQRSGWG